MENHDLKLSLCSYNCKNFSSDKYILIRKLIDNSTFVLLQEIWQHEKQFRENLEINMSNTDCHVVSPMNDGILTVGRGHGGVAIIWKKNLKCKIENIHCDSKRLCAIKVKLDDFEFILGNIYMPTDPGSVTYDLLEYTNVLDVINQIRINSDIQNIILGGDWNTDLSRNNKQTNTFVSFIDNESLHPAIDFFNANVPFTFKPSRSTIDHFVISDSLWYSLEMYESLFDVDCFSDHVPVRLQLKIDINYHAESIIARKPTIAWYKCTQQHINMYQDELNKHLSEINQYQTVFTCVDVHCDVHSDAISKLYSDIIDALKKSDIFFPRTGSSTTRSDPIPGWNDYVKNYREKAMLWHNIWIDCGKPHHGEVANIRRQTRAKYHYAIRFVDKQKNTLKSDKMAEAIMNNDSRNLWREVKKLKTSSKSFPNSMDSAIGSEKINNLFYDKYKTLYNSVGYNENEMNDLLLEIDSSINATDWRFTSYMINFIEVQDAINLINSNKKEEIGINTNHFKMGPKRLAISLALLFNCMLTHGQVPSEMNLGTMAPLIKDVKKSKQDSDNYRSLTIGSCIGKILDMVLLKKFQNKLTSGDNQFGFKKNVSTNMCTFVLKETISYYKMNKNAVYCLFLDASKAFDRVNFVKLFKKICDRGICPISTRLMLSMYLNQKNQVKWNQHISSLFTIQNGVKQGGILSPILFAVYMDNLLIELKNTGLGCYIGNIFCGALGYADDIVLIAPTKIGLNGLIKTCENYSIEHDIIFNGKKSKLLIFNQTNQHNCNISVNGERVPVVNSAIHLGNLISTNNDYDCIDYGISKFNSSFNSFFATFGKCDIFVKNKLFTQYCSSIYGSQIWPIWNKSRMDKFYCKWRNAIRRIWKFPRNTHCNLLYVITGQNPLDAQLKGRFLRFYNTLCNSKNNIIHYFSKKMSCISGSTLNKNINQIMYEMNIDFNEFQKMSFDDLKRSYKYAWLRTISDLTYDHAIFILELCLIRDNLNSMNLNYNECTEIINYLCTS